MGKGVLSEGVANRARSDYGGRTKVRKIYIEELGRAQVSSWRQYLRLFSVVSVLYFACGKAFVQMQRLYKYPSYSLMNMKPRGGR